MITNVVVFPAEAVTHPEMSYLTRLLREVTVHANFTVHRFRRNEQVSQFVGRYRYRLRVVDGALKIALREAILDSQVGWQPGRGELHPVAQYPMKSSARMSSSSMPASSNACCMAATIEGGPAR